MGPNRFEYLVNASTFTQPLVTGCKPYAAADTETTHATLAVRDRARPCRRAAYCHPPDRWAFGTCPTGAASLQRTATDLCLFDAFQPTKIYELVYRARDPIATGLAYSVTLDQYRRQFPACPWPHTRSTATRRRLRTPLANARSHRIANGYWRSRCRDFT